MKVTNNQTKVHYKGSNEDFIIYVDSEAAVKEWKDNKKEGVDSGLTNVVSNFEVYVSHKHGAQGVFDKASDQQLEEEFGTKVDVEVLAQILEKGNVQTSGTAEKTGPKNDSMGPMSAH